MLIPEFWCGVIFTILAEVVLILLGVAFSSNKKGDGK